MIRRSGHVACPCLARPVNVFFQVDKPATFHEDHRTDVEDDEDDNCDNAILSDFDERATDIINKSVVQVLRKVCDQLHRIEERRGAVTDIPGRIPYSPSLVQGRHLCRL